MSRKIIITLGPIVLLMLIKSDLLSQCAHYDITPYRLNKIASEVLFKKFNINNISTFIYNDGRADINDGQSGFECPIGSGKHVVYESGLILAGYVGDSLHLLGSTFGSGLKPGTIDEGGNEYEKSTSIYRVRKDFREGDLIAEMNDEKKTYSEIYQEYENDWFNWPAELGAPFEDVDKDGEYNPDIDIPGIPGSDQTIFYVANSADRDHTIGFYASPPTKIEVQVTVWGYKSIYSLCNTIFKRYRFINRDTSDVKDAFIGIWNDADVGGRGDDFCGCDTLLNLGFTYNADNDDKVYFNSPPAFGIKLLQGPIRKASPIDQARLFNRYVDGFENSQFYAYMYYVNEDCGSGFYSDPTFDDYRFGTVAFYHHLLGTHIYTGEQVPIPIELGGGSTRFPLSGDPLSGSGYVDGIIKPTDDRRSLMSIGPFNLAVGDTQEIVYAQLVEGNRKGVNNLKAVELLKNSANNLELFYENFCSQPVCTTLNQITSVSTSSKTILKWSNEPEDYNFLGYKFQGYNIYQVEDSHAPVESGVKIKTFDKIDGVKTITGELFYNGKILTQVLQQGNDWGIEHELEITKDYLRNTLLSPGSDYYFAITNYNYSETPWGGSSTFESEPSYVTVTYQGEEGPDIERINIFPNPYYGANPNELNKYQRFVTFSHLPEQATIRIFNLAGQLIKAIYKSEPGQFQRWDLMNDHNFLVPGGIYIAYIEMPELGETKVLKLAVVTENIIPDYY